LHTPHHSTGQLEVEVRRESGRTTITLTGELDLASVPLFTEALERERESAETALVDLAPLTFADSTGIKALVQAARNAASDGSRLLMTRPTGHVAQLFELTGLHLALPFAPDSGAA
jgi:anti-anti-sigma factor